LLKVIEGDKGDTRTKFIGFIGRINLIGAKAKEDKKVII